MVFGGSAPLRGNVAHDIAILSRSQTIHVALLARVLRTYVLHMNS